VIPEPSSEGFLARAVAPTFWFLGLGLGFWGGGGERGEEEEADQQGE